MVFSVHCYKIIGPTPLPTTPVARPKVNGNGGVLPCSILAASDGVGVFTHSIPDKSDDVGSFIPFPIAAYSDDIGPFPS